MQHLILLHGALGSKDYFKPLAAKLEHSFQVHTFNFSGHGGRPFSDTAFSIPFFSEQIAEYMQETGIEQANIFGYSMGGYAAMYLAKHHPEKINKLITLATKFYWDEKTAAKEVKMLDGKTIQEKVPAFAAQLQQRHAPNDWLLLLEKTAQLLTGLGKQNTLNVEDYASITIPCMVLLGDRDKMVTLDETIAVYKQLPNAQLGVLPGTPHLFEQVNVELLKGMIEGFMKF
ncbi:alpha/beta hydrolase [Niastella caeni]|uniref:Alpha/beta hydrolase n=1 Tax=Niastella caeni TaxID=2569763 RepID=A0A4S8HWW6_9BACT|nr:alpha/beta hydrolase [Niastella caeni]THU39249.1 alpha/beta hydrolase [Niastella caeni]